MFDTLSLFTSFQIMNRLCSICQWWLVNFIFYYCFYYRLMALNIVDVSTYCSCLSLTIPSFASKEPLQVDSYDTMTLVVSYCFLLVWSDILGSPCTFPALDLELAVSPRQLDSFQWEMVSDLFLNINSQNSPDIWGRPLKSRRKIKTNKQTEWRKL